MNVSTALAQDAGPTVRLGDCKVAFEHRDAPPVTYTSQRSPSVIPADAGGDGRAWRRVAPLRPSQVPIAGEPALSMYRHLLTDSGLDDALRTSVLAPVGGRVVQRCGGRACPEGGCHHDGDLLVAPSRIDPQLDAAPSVVHRVMSEPGTPLSPAVRADVEQRFGQSFAAVRIHTDSSAAASATAIRARAYTVGSHVAFAQGEYRPETNSGRRLLAHELTHVIQQSGAVSSANYGALAVAQSSNSLEREADMVAAKVVSLSCGGRAPAVNVQPVQMIAFAHRQLAGTGTVGRTQEAGNTTAGMTVTTPVRVAASLRSHIGEVDYYLLRRDDFRSRHPDGHSPPDYYLDYGDKYIRRFRNKLRPRLSRDGQAWLDCTLLALQAAIEDRRDANPVVFAQLEEDNQAFRSFAYVTHPGAYVTCGICSLPVLEELSILNEPDFLDIFGMDGLKQIFIALSQCAEIPFREAERSIYGLYDVPWP